MLISICDVDVIAVKTTVGPSFFCRLAKIRVLKKWPRKLPFIVNLCFRLTMKHAYFLSNTVSSNKEFF